MLDRLGPPSFAAPAVFLILLAEKMVTKIVGVYPTTKLFRYAWVEGVYTTLRMSTGLTFGTNPSLFGLPNHIITRAQHSYLVATVIASAVVPTLIANASFLPR